MWGCFLMSGVKILHFLKDWWKSIPIHQNYTMALIIWKCMYLLQDNNLPFEPLTVLFFRLRTRTNRNKSPEKKKETYLRLSPNNNKYGLTSRLTRHVTCHTTHANSSFRFFAVIHDFGHWKFHWFFHLLCWAFDYQVYVSYFIHLVFEWCFPFLLL